MLTDKEGVFLIKGLKPGPYTISAAKEKDGYAPSDSMFHSVNLTLPLPVPVTVLAGQQTSDIVIHLGPKAASLVGYVLDALTTRPIGDIQIMLRRVDNPDYSYMTGPDLKGEYKILVPPVPITIEVSAPGYEKRHLGSLQLRPPEIKQLKISLRPNK